MIHKKHQKTSNHIDVIIETNIYILLTNDITNKNVSITAPNDDDSYAQENVIFTFFL